MVSVEEILKKQENGLDVVRVKLVTDRQLFIEKELHYPDEVADELWPYFAEFDREVFAILNMNTAGRPMNMEIVSVGTLNGALISPREVFKSSVLSNANGIICIHNHPSGRDIPSKEDQMITYRLQTAGSILGIEVLDHIIMAGGNVRHYHSMRENGEMLDKDALNQRVAESILPKLEKEEKEPEVKIEKSEEKESDQQKMVQEEKKNMKQSR